MKKFLLILLVICMSLCACSGEKTYGSDTVGTTAAKEAEGAAYETEETADEGYDEETAETTIAQTAQKTTTASTTTTAETTAKKTTSTTTTAETTKQKTEISSADATTTQNESSNQSKNSGSGNSVTVPDEEEYEGNLVWVPTNGGTKYHSKSSCSKMKDPMQVTKETAIENGYTACKKCY